MKATLCKVCGHRHYGTCFSTTLVEMVTDVAEAGAELTAALEGKPKIKFDRNAYQREYMRKRRAKDKAK